MESSTNQLKPIIPAEMNPPLNTRLITDSAGLDMLEDFFHRQTTMGYDIETNIVDRYVQRKIRTQQFGDRNEQYLIDWWELAGRDIEYLKHIQGDYGKNWPTEGPFAKLKKIIIPVLDSNKYLKVGHNLQFDYMGTAWCMGVFMWNVWCTYICEKVRWAGQYNFKMRGFWGLKPVVGRWTGLELSKENQTTFWPVDDKIEPITPSQLEYAGLDVRMPLAVMAGQKMVFQRDDLMGTVQIENDAVPAFGDMHMNGFYLHAPAWMERVIETRDRHVKHVAALDEVFLPLVGEKGTAPTEEELLALAQQYESFGIESEAELAVKQEIQETKDKEVKAELRERLGKLKDKRKKNRAEARDALNSKRKLATWFRNEGDKMEGKAMINYGSPAQLYEVLTTKFKGITKSKLKDTNDKTLKKFEKDFPICKLIMDYRETAKLLSSYGEEYLEHIDSITGRIHPDMDQMGAETGRTSCSNPNLQNVPKVPIWRACFRAREGWKLITRDLEGCELRIMADASGETIWIEAFRRKEDIHEIVAFNVTNATKGTQVWIDWTEDGCKFLVGRQKCKCKQHADQRDKMKAVDFGIGYGLSVFGLKDQLACSEEVAAQIIAAWKAANPTLSKALDRWGDETKMKGEARTLGGRRRLFPKPDFETARRKLQEDYKKKGWEGIPTGNKVMNYMIRVLESIKRAGCNHKIQGTNADLAKLAVGCGFDEHGKPFLWHYTRPDRQFGVNKLAEVCPEQFHTEAFALMENLVHDELVAESPDKFAEEMNERIADALTRAGARFVKSIEMTTDGHVDQVWRK